MCNKTHIHLSTTYATPSNHTPQHKDPWQTLCHLDRQRTVRISGIRRATHDLHNSQIVRESCRRILQRQGIAIAILALVAQDGDNLTPT